MIMSTIKIRNRSRPEAVNEKRDDHRLAMGVPGIDLGLDQETV